MENLLFTSKSLTLNDALQLFILIFLNALIVYTLFKLFKYQSLKVLFVYVFLLYFRNL